MTTPPTTLHERLAAELARRTAAANAAGTPPPDPAADWQVEPTPIKDVYRVVDGDGSLVADVLVGEELAAHIALHDPADALRRYAGELEVLERHAPVPPRADDPWAMPDCTACKSWWPCPEIRSLASRLGVSVDG